MINRLIDEAWGIKTIDPLMYEGKVGCFNCDHIYIIEVKKGKQVDDFLKDSKLKCIKCECLETLQPWKQYLAGRAMMAQIMELSKREEDIESRKVSHFG